MNKTSIQQAKSVSCYCSNAIKHHLNIENHSAVVS